MRSVDYCDADNSLTRIAVIELLGETEAGLEHLTLTQSPGAAKDARLMSTKRPRQYPFSSVDCVSWALLLVVKTFPADGPLVMWQALAPLLSFRHTSACA